MYLWEDNKNFKPDMDWRAQLKMVWSFILHALEMLKGKGE